LLFLSGLSEGVLIFDAPIREDGLKRHPRFKVHFTPTSSTWMNMVERFFAEITREVI
jgi:hypothetical protein